MTGFNPVIRAGDPWGESSFKFYGFLKLSETALPSVFSAPIIKVKGRYVSWLHLIR